MTWLRWLLVIVTPFIATAVILLVARMAVTISNGQCAADSLAGGLCVEAWHTTAMDSIILIAIAAFVVAVVILPAMLAPSFKRVVAIVGFLIAVTPVSAIYLATRWPDLLFPAVLGLVVAIASVSWVWIRERARYA
jgi:hypothetical protein